MKKLVTTFLLGAMVLGSGSASFASDLGKDKVKKAELTEAVAIIEGVNIVPATNSEKIKIEDGFFKNQMGEKINFDSLECVDLKDMEAVEITTEAGKDGKIGTEDDFIMIEAPEGIEIKDIEAIELETGEDKIELNF